ncbi:kinase-like protein, partial [Saitoella complicata NRRL Y-17804]|uniref:kinase-like protein n=1 Tax=Saitoella complicata (strain BCRC 22490 / CBS 7301 / JCM 7358 / NBRC 10748 / NRRL Y-17804) TaxID=698492 RepID=UPI000867446E
MPPPSPRVASLTPPTRATPPSIKDFDIIKPISKGAFGSVYLAKKKTTGEYFAIKILKKADMIAKNQVTNVRAERAILMAQGENPFVAKLWFTFQTKEYLYLVMEYCNGGDCAALIKILGGLSEDWAKKYMAEIVLGVKYLHEHGIVHRDLKPDNFLIDQRGHLKLTDFGLSRMGLIGRQHRAQAHVQTTDRNSPELFVGTPDYLAPETIKGTGQDEMSDWWSLGCILFEFMFGVPPFHDETPEKVFENILERRIIWPEEEDGDEHLISEQARDLINRLLCVDQTQRLGANGADEVTSHPFFKGINWEHLLDEEASFVPTPDNPEDTEYFDRR